MSSFRIENELGSPIPTWQHTEIKKMLFYTFELQVDYDDANIHTCVGGNSKHCAWLERVSMFILSVCLSVCHGISWVCSSIFFGVLFIF